jgi:hypothetical protein
LRTRPNFQTASATSPFTIGYSAELSSFLQFFHLSSFEAFMETSPSFNPLSFQSSFQVSLNPLKTISTSTPPLLPTFTPLRNPCPSHQHTATVFEFSLAFFLASRFAFVCGRRDSDSKATVNLYFILISLLDVRLSAVFVASFGHEKAISSEIED